MQSTVKYKPSATSTLDNYGVLLTWKHYAPTLVQVFYPLRRNNHILVILFVFSIWPRHAEQPDPVVGGRLVRSFDTERAFDVCVYNVGLIYIVKSHNLIQLCHSRKYDKTDRICTQHNILTCTRKQNSLRIILLTVSPTYYLTGCKHREKLKSSQTCHYCYKLLT